MEGVFGQFLAGDLSPIGGEFRVNGTTASPSIAPRSWLRTAREDFWRSGRVLWAGPAALI